MKSRIRKRCIGRRCVERGSKWSSRCVRREATRFVLVYLFFFGLGKHGPIGTLLCPTLPNSFFFFGNFLFFPFFPPSSSLPLFKEDQDGGNRDNTSLQL